MKIDRVVFTKDEAGWFSRNVIKMKQVMEEKSRKDPKILERTTYKLVCNMQEKAAQAGAAVAAFDEHPFEIEVMLSRKQKVFLKGLIETMVQGLENVNKKYEERGNLQDYIDRNEQKRAYLKSMIRKLK